MNIKKGPQIKADFLQQHGKIKGYDQFLLKLEGRKGELASGLCLLPTFPSSPLRARRSSAPRKAPPLAPKGYACSLGARRLGLAGGNRTPVSAAGNSLGVDNSGETETQGNEATSTNL